MANPRRVYLAPIVRGTHAFVGAIAPDDQIDPVYPGGLELLGRHTVADRDVVLLIWPPEDLGHAPTIPHRDGVLRRAGADPKALRRALRRIEELPDE